MSVLTELRKALQTTGDGAALAATDFEQVLHEELLKLQPLAQLMDIQQSEGLTHSYTVRSSHPLGWFEGEATPANQRNSAYSRKTVAMKIIRNWGGVTGFAQALSDRFINALAEEIVGELEGMANVIEYSSLYGTANDIGFTGDAYQYSGLIPRVFAYAPSNVVDAGGDVIALADLNNALAKVTGYRLVRTDPKLWMMGVQMKQVVDGLQTKVQMPLTSVELADGKIEMDAYGRTPILESDFVVPASTSTSPTLAGAKAAGGSLADATYNYKISSVTAYGEQVASAALGAAITTETTNNTVNLTWTADPNAKLYMIWRNVASGTYQLLDIINALTYDANGTVSGAREAYSDTGARTPIAVKPLADGEQQIVIANINPRRGASFVGKIDDMGQPLDNLVQFVELARVKDSYDFMLKSYHAVKLIHPNLVAVVRHAKLA